MGNPKAKAFKRAQELADAQHRIRTEPRELAETPSFSGFRRAQIVFAPSFGDKYAWEIYAVEDSLRLYRSDLVFHEHRYKLLNHDEIVADPSILQGILNRLCSLSLPMQPELRKMAGCGGVDFQLALEGYLYSAIRVQWWSEAPAHWSELTNMVTEIIESFRSLSLAATASIPNSESAEA